MEETKWPVNLEEAVERTISLLSSQERASIAKLPKKDLWVLHMSLGMLLRNVFGMHRGNNVLIAACGAMEPDGASEVILEAAWKKLRGAR